MLPYLYKFLRDVNFVDDQNCDFHSLLFKNNLLPKLVVLFADDNLPIKIVEISGI